MSIAFDLKRIDFYDGLLNEIELEILRHAKRHDANTLQLLDSVPGVGKILSLVLLYEIHDIHRFPTVQDFASYCRLVKPRKESADKCYGFSGAKIGNAHLKWAFSEAGVLFLRHNPQGRAYLARLEKKPARARRSQSWLTNSRGGGHQRRNSGWRATRVTTDSGSNSIPSDNSLSS